jgi:predicted lipid-binding transport protein (Tim44 family)
MSDRPLFDRVALAALAMSAAVDAAARTGGGSHSGGGSNSSGGSSHSYSSGSVYSYSSGSGQLSSGEAIVLLIVMAAVFYFIWRWKRNAEALPQQRSAPLAKAVTPIFGAPGAPRQAPALQSNRPSLPADIATIGARDPGFEIETFLQRAEMSYFLVKRGIQNNDAAAVRPYLNDALFSETTRLIGQSKTQHRHTLLESLNVRAVHLVNAGCNDQGQTLEVHFDLVYRAKSVDDANRVLADEGNDGRHGERWTFVRSPSARTSSIGNVTASRCPACGAELNLSLDGVCTHCKASVTNGSVDWVVANIRPAPFVGYTSESQLAAGAPSVAEGVALMRSSDPAFSIDAFRVRVRTAFVALQDAWCHQHLDTARAFLSPGAYFAWRAQLETMAAEGRRNVMERLQVQSIQPMRLVHGRVFDDLTVRITAACADYEIDKDGKIVFGDRTVRPFTEEWTFQRSAGATTSNKPGTLENTCPSCGAPVSLTQIGECRYCKAAVTTGRFDWVVSRIEQEDMSMSGGDSNEGSAAA